MARTSGRPQTFAEVLTAAVADLTDHGFDSMERVDRWTRDLLIAAEREASSPERVEALMREGLTAIYRRQVDHGGIYKYHPGVSRYTLDQIKPKLRAELDRRIMASANLIKLNRREMIAKTVQRFQGWATSIPQGGTKQTDKVKTKTDVRKSLKQLPFLERRVLIDQGHKLSAAISDIVAKDGGAIAVKWRSHWRQHGYDYRPDHKDRDGEIYAIRGCWALDKGLMRAGPAGYYDDITAVGEEVFCRCWAEFIYTLRSLPTNMLTKKGAAALTRAAAAAAAA
jgi:hypothetical protein